jgi:hypothetical protein
MRVAFELARRARLRALLGQQLSNAGDVWTAYNSGTKTPPLRFRNGLTPQHGAGDAPVFLSALDDAGFSFATVYSRRCGPLFRARRIDA